jgi:hypothetical protein
VVDRKDYKFYAKYGFTLIPDSGRMFMTIKKIEEAMRLSS